MSWTITIPGKAPGMNGPGGMIRAHWAKQKKAKDSIATLVCALAPNRNRIDGPVRITYVQHYARSPRDLDNFAASIKYPLDAIVRLGVLADDDPTVFGEYVTRQEKTARVKDERFTITIEQIK